MAALYFFHTQLVQAFELCACVCRPEKHDCQIMLQFRSLFIFSRLRPEIRIFATCLVNVRAQSLPSCVFEKNLSHPNRQCENVYVQVPSSHLFRVQTPLRLDLYHSCEGLVLFCDYYHERPLHQLRWHYVHHYFGVSLGKRILEFCSFRPTD